MAPPPATLGAHLPDEMYPLTLAAAPARSAWRLAKITGWDQQSDGIAAITGWDRQSDGMIQQKGKPQVSPPVTHYLQLMIYL